MFTYSVSLAQEEDRVEISRTPTYRRKVNMATGTVKWFNSEKGFGFIAVDGGQDVLLTLSNSRKRLQVPEEGQAVSFEVAQGPKGLRPMQ